jgi:hypothetical protein
MKQLTARASLSTPRKKTTSQKNDRLKSFFTPYTQRPIELWLKNEVIQKMPDRLRFELDETLGGNKAPLTSRMHFLKFHLKNFQMLEVLPKLTVALLTPSLKINQKTIAQYRDLEKGAEARQIIIEKMCDHLDIFIYDRDLKKLTQSLNAFDAFICAYTVLLSDRNECAPIPKAYPSNSSWIHYPKSEILNPQSRFHATPEDEESES